MLFAYPIRQHILNTVSRLSSSVILVIALCLLTSIAHAFDTFSIDVEQIQSNDWQLKGVSLALFDIEQQTPKLALSIKQLVLPKPFNDITFFDVQCLSFNWQDNQIVCQQGKASLKSRYFHSSPFDFSFAITEKQSHFSINNLRFSQGVISVHAKAGSEDWRLKFTSKDIQLQSLKPLLAELIDDISSGSVTLDINATGNNTGVNQLRIKALFNQVSLQARQGEIATEALNFSLDLTAKQKQGVWQWQNNNQILHGELYVAPIYLDIKSSGLQLDTKGLWHKKGLIELQQAKLIQPDVVEINASGLIITQSGDWLDKAHIKGHVENLELFTQQYVMPFMEQTGLEGIQFKGQFETEIDVKHSVIQQVSVAIKQLDVSDDKNRIAINQAQGELNWSKTKGLSKPSEIFWHKLKIKAIPIEAGELKFQWFDQQISLLEKTSIPLLGGTLDINQFNWSKHNTEQPAVYFSGGIHELSLEQLSTALDWTPLSGHISGSIPSIDYKDKTLTVNGGLTINAFDGVIKINKLASSGLFTDFSKFYLDMELDNLDLYALTQKFKMGEMEGRVSGFITDLYLENGSPVTFYAWIGTPDNDNSRHRISQKAVQNIASIGGGGAADVISKGFLRFFDSFGYERLGFGCYLHQGVCQLMGVEAAEQGYYIIKGGGIPRIDVLGYNPQVDWAVLMQRLSRISTTDNVVIE